MLGRIRSDRSTSGPFSERLEKGTSGGIAGVDSPQPQSDKLGIREIQALAVGVEGRDPFQGGCIATQVIA